MNIIITAGGNTERIDSVRTIRNTGTGRLGALTAERLALADAGNHIFYICDRHAETPFAPRSFREFEERFGGFDDIGLLADAAGRIRLIYADDVTALGGAVRKVCGEHRIDAVVHSMAVSDYRVKNVTTAAAAATAVAAAADPAEAILGALDIRGGGKISSDLDDVLVVLEKAPKIISLYRGLAPDAVIIGFKLLSNVDEEELIRVGLNLLKKNDCDYVLANDTKYLTDGGHIGHLIARDGSYRTYDGKDAIADALVRAVSDGADAAGPRGSDTPAEPPHAESEGD